MWNKRNDSAIRQQFKADFRMALITFMNIVTSGIDQKNKTLDFVKLFQLKKEYRLLSEAATSAKTVAQVLSCGIYEISKNNWTTASVLYGISRLGTPTAELQKHLLFENRLLQTLSSIEIFYQISQKFLMLSVQFGLLELISHNPMLF